MPIPKEKGRKEERERLMRKLRRESAEETALIRANLRQARMYAIHHDNGDTDAIGEMRAHLSDAIDNGLAPSAITIGGGMVGRINAILDRPESQNHAAGLALCLADLLADFDPAKAAEVMAIADGIRDATPEEVEKWREIATPVKIVDRF